MGIIKNLKIKNVQSNAIGRPYGPSCCRYEQREKKVLAKQGHRYRQNL